MATGDKNDMAVRLKSLLPARWFSDAAPILGAILTGLGNAWASVYSLIGFTKSIQRLSTAQGGFIDLFANDYLGEAGQRLPGEGDAAYAARTKANLVAPYGTLPGIIEQITSITGRVPVVIETMNPASCGGWASRANPIAGGGMLAWDDGTGTKGKGAFGSLLLPFQFFITVFRPLGRGIASLGGWGSLASPFASGGLGGWSTRSTASASSQGAVALVGGSMVPPTVSDRQIYDTVAQNTPNGSVAWTRLS